ncbi:MAG TPA: glycosyltransferase [Chloroflexia bacterium]|nr:glycosyltransferase [Chloroflexia bacterium]
MAVKIIEMEWSAVNPIQDSSDLAAYDFLQILVRYHGRPINYAWIKLYPGQPLPELPFIRLEILRQLQLPLMKALVQELLEEAQPVEVDQPVELPFMSVVVPTRNRANSLRRTLESLKHLDYPPERFEILVVDNAPSDDSTRKVVVDFPNFKYFVEPRPGLEWTRNCGVRASRGEVVVFTDDDVEVDAGWLKALARQFANPAIHAVTGLVAPARLETEAENLFEEFGGFGKGFERSDFALALKRYWPFPVSAGVMGTGANMAFRKDVLQALGGFDPALGAGSLAKGAGDLDMFYRVVRAGYRLVYEPRALIWHFHRHDLPALENQFSNYGSGLYAFFTKAFLTDRAFRFRIACVALWWFTVHLLFNLFIQRKDKIRRGLYWKQINGALRGPYRYFQSERHRQKLVSENHGFSILQEKQF